jgi:hypothetical protein
VLKQYLEAKAAAAELPQMPKQSRKRKIYSNQPELSFAPSEKELSKSEINRLDKEAILIGANPSLSLDVVKKHQSMMRPG